MNLDLLGEGPLAPALNELSCQFQWLTVRGPVESDAVAGFMKGLDIYALPARVLHDHEEHDAHAMIQALACGIPAIGSKSGIIPEILGQEFGILVEPDDPAGLAESIIALASDATRRSQMSIRARSEALEKYSLEVVAERKARSYQQVIDAKVE